MIASRRGLVAHDAILEDVVWVDCEPSGARKMVMDCVLRGVDETGREGMVGVSVNKHDLNGDPPFDQCHVEEETTKTLVCQ